MKNLLTGILTLIGALIVTGIIQWALILFSLIKSIYESVTLKDWKAFFMFWWKIIDGTAFAIGDLLYNAGYFLDQMWNVTGELIEDTVTHEENSHFSEKEITVSASLGHLKQEGKLNKFGLFIDKLLNIAFMQHNHTIGAWLFFHEKKRIKEELFKPKK